MLKFSQVFNYISLTFTIIHGFLKAFEFLSHTHSAISELQQGK